MSDGINRCETCGTPEPTGRSDYERVWQEAMAQAVALCEQAESNLNTVEKLKYWLESLKPDNGESPALALHNAKVDGCRDEMKHWSKHLAVEYNCGDPDCLIPLALAERDKQVARECAGIGHKERLNLGAAVVGKDYSKGYSDGAGATAAAIRQRWGLK